MRLIQFALFPALLTLVSANLATDFLSYANDLVSSDGSSEALPGNSGDLAIKEDGKVRVADKWSWMDCGAATDAVQIRDIVVNPDPPVPGANLTVTVSADVLKEILEGAYVDVTVKLGVVQLLHKEFDICEEARNANATIQCPVQPGPYTVSQTVELPKEIPRAKFSIAVRGYTVDDEDMVCLDLFVDFMKRPGSIKQV